MAQTRTLQVRYLTRQELVAAGTAKATPQSTSWSLGRVILDSLDLRIPPGPAGLAGIAVLYAGVSIIPSEQPGEFWIGDDEQWNVEVGWEVSGPLTILTYNTDVYDHTFLLRAKVRDIALVVAGAALAGQTVLTAIPDSTPPSAENLAAAIAEPSAGEIPPEEPASLTALEGGP